MWKGLTKCLKIHIKKSGVLSHMHYFLKYVLKIVEDTGRQSVRRSGARLNWGNFEISFFLIFLNKGGP